MDTVNNKKTINILCNAIAVIFCAAYLYPFILIILSSFKTDMEIFSTAILPSHFSLDSYLNQYKQTNINIWRSFLSSVIISAGTMILSVSLALPAAYGLARFNFKGRKFFIIFFLMSQLLPPTLTLLPVFVMYKKMVLLDTYLAPIFFICVTGIPFSVVTMRTYFISIPKGLEDSARLDGCSRLSTFLRIIIPISYPGVIMIAAICFLFGWGDLIASLTFISISDTRPLTSQVNAIFGQYGPKWNFLMAYGTLIVIPVFIIFVSLQKYLVSGLASGAVKG